MEKIKLDYTTLERICWENQKILNCYQFLTIIYSMHQQHNIKILYFQTETFFIVGQRLGQRQRQGQIAGNIWRREPSKWYWPPIQKTPPSSLSPISVYVSNDLKTDLFTPAFWNIWLIACIRTGRYFMQKIFSHDGFVFLGFYQSLIAKTFDEIHKNESCKSYLGNKEQKAVFPVVFRLDSIWHVLWIWMFFLCVPNWAKK